MVSVTMIHKRAFLGHVPSKEALDQFFAEAGEQVTRSGHILESTEVAMLNN